MLKKKKYILDAEVEFDFAMIAVSSHQKDYKFCWSVNNTCHFKLKKEDDLQLDVISSTAKIPFSFYSYTNEKTENKYLLITNKNQGHYVLPELKPADFLIVIKGLYNQEMIAQLINDLKTIPSVAAAFEVAVNNLSNKQSLYFLS